MINKAIILAGGTGKRMNSNVPKQYMELHGKPILYYTIKAFQESFFDEIVLVCLENDIDYCRENIVNKYNFTKVSHIVAGGKERYHSVINGIKAVGESDYIYIHDGARPFATNEIFQNIKNTLESNDACIAAVAVKDTIKLVDSNGTVVDTPSREMLYQVQTPQAFKASLIIEAYNKLEASINNNSLNGLKITDDAMVVEHFTDAKVVISEGSYNNIKITSPEDIDFGEAILNKLLDQ